MFKINIISKVEMEPISQEVLEQMIIDQIAQQNPEVHVNSVTFVQRRDPARVEAVVDAQLGKPTGKKPEPVKEATEEVFTFDAPEVEKVKEVEDSAQSIADIFKTN